MGKTYRKSVYEDRRISWFNVSISTLYREAYNIYSYKTQEMYDSTVTGKDVSNFADKSTLYCVDLLVKPEQKDSLYILFRKYLNDFLPVKARLEKRMMNVYVLNRNDFIPLGIIPSTAQSSTYGFSGRGYDGTKGLVKDFASHYLTNELGLAVVDETGLSGYYDIKTNVEQRDWTGLMKSLKALGFKIEKSKREMPVIVYYK